MLLCRSCRAGGRQIWNGEWKIQYKEGPSFLFFPLSLTFSLNPLCMQTRQACVEIIDLTLSCKKRKSMLHWNRYLLYNSLFSRQQVHSAPSLPPSFTRLTLRFLAQSYDFIFLSVSFFSFLFSLGMKSRCSDHTQTSPITEQDDCLTSRQWPEL